MPWWLNGKMSKFRSRALFPNLPRRSTANRKTSPFSPTLQLVRRIYASGSYVNSMCYELHGTACKALVIGGLVIKYFSYHCSFGRNSLCVCVCVIVVSSTTSLLMNEAH